MVKNHLLLIKFLFVFLSCKNNENKTTREIVPYPDKEEQLKWEESQKIKSLKLNNEISIYWEIIDFDKSKHKYTYCEDSGNKYLCKIDGKEWFGSDRGLDFPKNELAKLEIEINGMRYPLETSQMYNPNSADYLSKNQFGLEKCKDFYRLYAFFSDGAGSYTAWWKISEGVSTREKLSNNEVDFSWQLRF